MGLLKFIIVGAAIAVGIHYITKENEDGKSILDDIIDEAPDYMERAKKYVELTIDQINERVQAR